MKKKKNINQKSINKTVKLINIALFLLFISPVFYYCMTYFQMIGSNQSFLDFIEASPQACLTMVYVCLNPFLGYILQLMKKRIQNCEDGTIVVSNLIVIMIVQMLSMNIIYLCFIAYILYLTFDIYHISFKELCHDMSISFLFSKVGGSITLLLINLFLSIININTFIS